jgi:hypothetical protein
VGVLHSDSHSECHGLVLGLPLGSRRREPFANNLELNRSQLELRPFVFSQGTGFLGAFALREIFWREKSTKFFWLIG